MTIPGQPKLQDTCWKGRVVKNSMSTAENVKALSNELQSSLTGVQQQKFFDKCDGSAGDQNIDEGATVDFL